MRNFLSLFLTLSILSLSTICKSQVNEIGHYFESTGFIQDIDYERKELIVNFPTPQGIFEETVLLTDPKTNALCKGITNVNVLRSGMEVKIIGDKLPKRNLIVANVILIKDLPKKLNVEKGRIDDIADDYAVIDGNKVKMKAGAKIIGDKKTLYKGKSFGSFRELMLGDFVDVDGSYDPKGFISATEVRVSPDLDTELDKEKRQIGQRSYHNVNYNDWIDPVKRKAFLGGEYGGRKIANSTGLQTYIQDLGSKMVPDFVKDKIQFMFMVLVDPEWNAFARPDGLVVVYTGLLEKMENEAQLAAIIGHEITHAIYEHSANKTVETQKIASRTSSNTQMIKGAANLSKLFADWVTVPNAKVANMKLAPATKRKLKMNIDSLSKSFATYTYVKSKSNESKYSIENESQSDRVGLYLLVKNGYDPREAMKVWKNSFNDSEGNPALVNPNGQAASEVSSFSNAFARYRKVPTPSDIGIYFFKNKFNRQTMDLYKQSVGRNGSIKSHPDDIKRFENQNRSLNLYYSDPAIISRSVTKEKEFRDVLQTANQEMALAEKLLEEKIMRENKRLADLNKAYNLAHKKLTAEVRAKQVAILNFKDFKVNPYLKLTDILPKSKCEVSGLKPLLGELYEANNVQFMSFVSDFKAGNVAPNKKNIMFALNYCTEKEFNRFMIEVAAGFQVCDTELLKSVKGLIESGDVKQILSPNKDDCLEVYEYLENLNRTDKK
ncbi:MAG: M48 family metalloprotease [Dyadobacter sp.]|uniref:M48 family metalloprotease n=1 Tax=Dyadobacter sp. TaxID=1914288 RepID=UPI0032641068